MKFLAISSIIQSVLSYVAISEWRKNAPPQNAVIWMELLISTVLFVLLNYQIEGFAHNGMIGWLYEVVVALAGSMMIILLSQIVAAHFKTASKALQHLGNRTLGIYALNTYLIIAFSIAFKNSVLLYPLSLVFVIGLSYAITIALSKNRLTSMLLLGEKNARDFLQTSK